MLKEGGLYIKYTEIINLYTKNIQYVKKLKHWK